MRILWRGPASYANRSAITGAWEWVGLGDRVDEVPKAAAEAVEAPDDQRAAIAMRSASLGLSWAVGGKAAGVVIEHALATSLGKGIRYISSICSAVLTRA